VIREAGTVERSRIPEQGPKDIERASKHGCEPQVIGIN